MHAHLRTMYQHSSASVQRVLNSVAHHVDPRRDVLELVVLEAQSKVLKVLGEVIVADVTGAVDNVGDPLSRKQYTEITTVEFQKQIKFDSRTPGDLTL